MQHVLECAVCMLGMPSVCGWLAVDIVNPLIAICTPGQHPNETGVCPTTCRERALRAELLQRQQQLNMGFVMAMPHLPPAEQLRLKLQLQLQQGQQQQQAPDWSALFDMKKVGAGPPAPLKLPATAPMHP